MTAKVDLSEFYKLSKPKSPPCQIGLVLKGEVTPALNSEELKQLEAALDSNSGVITATAIVKWLADRGHETNTNRVSGHRRKVCNCGKS